MRKKLLYWIERKMVPPGQILPWYIVALRYLLRPIDTIKWRFFCNWYSVERHALVVDGVAISMDFLSSLVAIPCQHPMWFRACGRTKSSFGPDFLGIEYSAAPILSDSEFKALLYVLNLLNLDGGSPAPRNIFLALADVCNRETRRRGYPNWLEAYAALHVASFAEGK